MPLHARGLTCIGLVVSISAAAAATDAPAFQTAVQPLLTKTCSPCHNDRLASGGLNLGVFSTPQSVTEQRDGWERILRKLRSGEMPPKGIPRPPAGQVEALMRFIDGEFERADRNVKPDPGRVTARRLNRSEYTNTIRDLLAVDFRADKDFPTDDTGHGFDNIGDVLTISPVLMEKYLNNSTSSKSANILLIEDNEADVYLMRRALDDEKFSYDLTALEDGEKALAFIRRDGEYAHAQRPKVIVLDLNLPRCSGIEVLEEIRGNAEFADLPVAVFTLL